MSRIAVAVLILVGILTPVNHAIATEAGAQGPIVVQKWHSGVWIAWDRNSQVRSTQVAIKPLSEFKRNEQPRFIRYVLNDFSYISLIERRSTFPLRDDFVVSVFAMDFELDGKTTPPTCIPFHSYPFQRSERVVNDRQCLSETIFRVSVDLDIRTVKKVRQDGLTFVGVRGVNPLASSSCQMGWSLASGKCEIADRLLYEEGRAVGGRVLYFDSVIHLPKLSQAYVGVQGQIQLKRKSQPQWHSISSLSSRDTLWRRESVVLHRDESQKLDSYRSVVWDSAKKRNIWFGPEIKVGNILTSRYGIDESLGGILTPVFTASANEE